MIGPGQAVVLGSVQGLTEFLPISSDGHLTLVQAWWALSGNLLALDVALHAGTLAAMLVFFRKDLAGLLDGFRAGEIGRVPRALLVRIALVTVSTGVVGFSLKPVVETLLTSYGAAGAGFLGTAAMLLWGEWGARRRGRLETTPEVSPLWHALVLGLAQGLAVWPGLSRSGSTIGLALALGWAWKGAGRFSFVAAVPAIAGATLLTAREMNDLPLTPALLGAAAAFLVGLLALRILMGFLAARRLWPFAIYTFLAGMVALRMGLRSP